MKTFEVSEQLLQRWAKHSNEEIREEIETVLRYTGPGPREKRAEIQQKLATLRDAVAEAIVDILTRQDGVATRLANAREAAK